MLSVRDLRGKPFVVFRPYIAALFFLLFRPPLSLTPLVASHSVRSIVSSRGTQHFPLFHCFIWIHILRRGSLFNNGARARKPKPAKRILSMSLSEDAVKNTNRRTVQLQRSTHFVFGSKEMDGILCVCHFCSLEVVRWVLRASTTFELCSFERRCQYGVRTSPNW